MILEKPETLFDYPDIPVENQAGIKSFEDKVKDSNHKLLNEFAIASNLEVNYIENPKVSKPTIFVNGTEFEYAPKNISYAKVYKMNPLVIKAERILVMRDYYNK